MAILSKNKWFILDTVSQIQSPLMSEEQLQAMLLRINTKEHTRYSIKSETAVQWESISDFLKNNHNLNFLKKDTIFSPELENTITKSVTYVRPEKENLSYNHKSDSSADMSELDLKNIQAPHNLNFKKLGSVNPAKNRLTRHDFKIEVLLVAKNGKSFRSYSKNISLSGTLLEDNIPFDYYGELFDVIIMNRYAKEVINSRVQIKGKTVGDGVSRRIEFSDYSENIKTKLIFLLHEYIEHQKNSLKKIS